MQGTHLECGWFTCSDHSHSAGRSWVDIVGGVSQTCEDHSTSFYGPNGGEWDMCDQYGFTNQRSTGQQWITGVNQHWDRFPQIGGCPPQPVAHMNHPFMSIYDLDYCFDKQLAGTIYFSNFPLYSTRLSGDCDNPYSNVVRYAFTGGDSLKCCGGDQSCQTTEIARYWDWSCAGYSYCEDPQSTCDFNTGECVQTQTQCFQPHCEGGCSNNKLCSDLNVVGTYTCTWYEPPPCRPRFESCDQGSDCCSGNCFDGSCW